VRVQVTATMAALGAFAGVTAAWFLHTGRQNATPDARTPLPMRSAVIGGVAGALLLGSYWWIRLEKLAR
jgi:hypothetical protein